jgi:hypothetical protein
VLEREQKQRASRQRGGGGLRIEQVSHEHVDAVRAHAAAVGLVQLLLVEQQLEQHAHRPEGRVP